MSGFSISKFLGLFNKNEDSTESKSLSANVITKNQPAGGGNSSNIQENPELDASLVAVITAAVAMMMSSESGTSAPYPGFRVRKIRRLY